MGTGSKPCANISIHVVDRLYDQYIRHNGGTRRDAQRILLATRRYVRKERITGSFYLRRDDIAPYFRGGYGKLKLLGIPNGNDFCIFVKGTTLVSVINAT